MHVVILRRLSLIYCIHCIYEIIYSTLIACTLELTRQPSVLLDNEIIYLLMYTRMQMYLDMQYS